MKEVFYKTIYNKNINKIILSLLRPFKVLIPKKLRISPNGIVKIKQTGKEDLKISTNQTNYLGNIIFWDNYENFEYTNLFLSIIKNINSFYDIGANIGYYSLLAAWINPKIIVTAFEPASGPYNYLKENVAINSFHQIKIEKIALSNIVGDITFYEIRNKKYSYLEHNLAGEGNIGSLTEGRNFVKVDVPSCTLDQYCVKNNVDSIDLIKIDTEGTEDLILSCAKKIIQNAKPIIICEILFNKIEKKIEDLFKSFGYRFFYPVANKLVEVKSLTRTEDNGIYNFFMIHPSKFYLVEEYFDN